MKFFDYFFYIIKKINRSLVYLIFKNELDGFL